MPYRGSRRQVLQLAGGGSVLITLGTSSAAARQSTPAATPEALASEGLISIVPTGAELPTEDVTITWMVRGAGSKGIFLEQLFPVYEQAHPNITIQYEGLPPAELTRILPLGFQSGEPPDAFEVSDAIPAYEMVRQGWVRPIDDIMPGFDAWKASVPPGVLVDGITTFDGQVYGFPYLSNDVTRLTLYNSAYMEQAGFDPAAEPLTWDTFREAARAITEQGGGEYYGYIIGGQQADQWGIIALNLAELGGATGGEIDWATGQYQYTAAPFQAAIELLVAMNDDGSFHPATMQSDNVVARARTAEGEAGMILEGPWNIPVWNLDYPDFQYGAGSLPVGVDVAQPTVGVAPGAWLPMWVAAESEHPEVAGDIFAYLASEEGQIDLATVTQGFPIALSETARQRAAEEGVLDPRMVRAYEIFEEQVMVLPDPRARNADVQAVYAELRQLTPNFGEVVQGLFTGQLDDIGAALQDLQDRAEAELERAITAAQEGGAQVSRDDWAFANWDPTRDYTAEDYEGL